MEFVNKEILSIVDKDGNQVAQIPKGEKILDNNYIETVHCIILNEFKEVLLQKRSDNKIVAPGKWDFALGGHVRVGENPKEALIREIYEELFINAESSIKLDQYILDISQEKQFVHLFILPISKSTVKNFNSEISEVKWFDLRFVDQISDILDLNTSRDYLDELIKYTNNFIKSSNEK